MTFEQLRIFVAVAERQHLTNAAEVLHLTPSALSASIKALEARYNVKLFDRVGRRIELTALGARFLLDAQETIAKLKATESVLAEIGDLSTGRIAVQASQTIANYWLPPRLIKFSERYPGVEIEVRVGNTKTVAAAILDGEAELGLIEGDIDQPALAVRCIAHDRLVVVARPALAHAKSRTDVLTDWKWILREPGSGTRSAFEQAFKALNLDEAALDVALVLPSNEAVLTAVRHCDCVTAISEVVAAPFLDNGELCVLSVPLPLRQFSILRHKQRVLSLAGREFLRVCTD